MSLIGLALRVSAVRALRHAGVFETRRIFDSAFLPIDKVAKNEQQPFAIVSTEAMATNPSGRDINTGDRSIDLILEIGTTRTVLVDTPDGPQPQTRLAETDASLEAGIAFLERQCMACLFGRGGGEWGAVFRALTSQISEITSVRGVMVEGVRFSARQITFAISAIAEPAFGQSIEEGTPLAQFLAQAEADADLADLAASVRALAEGEPQDWPAIYNATAMLGGYTDAEGGQLGLDPVDPATFEQIDIENTDTGETWPVNEDTANSQDP